MTDDEAIQQAVLFCKDHDILKDFLKQFGKEVVNMFSLQWNEEEALKYWKEYAAEKGIATATMKFIRNQLKRRVPYQQIAEDTDTSLDEVLRIAKESNMVY